MQAVAIAPANPSQLMTLIGNSTIKLPVQPTPAKVGGSLATLLFDDATGALTPSTKSPTNVNPPLVHSLGAEWVVLPQNQAAQTSKLAAAPRTGR
jgi:hypothetical protein